MNPALPAGLLDRFVAGADGDLSRGLACRDDLSGEHVRVLAGKGAELVLLRRGLLDPAEVSTADPWTALYVVERPDADPALIRELAGHPEPFVRADLTVRVERLPAEVVDQLAHDPVASVVAAVAEYQPLSPRLADELSGHPDDEVRAALARNPAAPPAVLLGSVAHEDYSVRGALAVRPDLPGWAYERLARDADSVIRAEVAANPAVGTPVLRELAADPERRVRRALAHNPVIPLDLLGQLAVTTRIGPTVVPRIAAAGDAELRVLATDTATQVRMLVAARPDLPADLVELFVGDPDTGVAQGIVANPAVTAEQVWALVDRHGPRLYPRAARNPNCPPDLLRHLAENAGKVRQAYQSIARHPNADADTLLLCLRDRQARYHVAGHPNLPARTVVELLADHEVALHAAANPALPEWAMADLLHA